MRILHGCLAAFYIDGASYQENLLPKAHKNQGHDVLIVASTENYVTGGKLGYVEPRRYTNDDGIPVIRLPYRGWMPHFVARKLRMYVGLRRVLDDFAPDIIFLHDLQFLDSAIVAAYMRDHPSVRLFVDGHTDEFNSARTWASRFLLHGIVYRWCARELTPHAQRFWGVTPLRSQFMRRVYGIDPSKLGVLVMGYDDTAVNLSRRQETRRRVRAELGIANESFVVVSGGRIEPRKRIDTLLRAMHDPALADVTLLLFGEPIPSVRDQIRRLANRPNIRMVGWLSPDRIYDMLLASDLGCFPGSHSVLWEQAVGIGLPCVFKRLDGFEHVDLGGNCVLLDEVNETALASTLLAVVSDSEMHTRMRLTAETRGPERFSYSRISRVAIGQLEPE